jgi:hypothetical protein
MTCGNVGPVGLEPTTYGLKVAPALCQRVLCGVGQPRLCRSEGYRVRLLSAGDHLVSAGAVLFGRSFGRTKPRCGLVISRRMRPLAAKHGGNQLRACPREEPALRLLACRTGGVLKPRSLAETTWYQWFSPCRRRKGPASEGGSAGRRRVRVTVTGPNPYDPSVSQPIGERKRTVEEALAQGMAGWSRVGSVLAKPLEELGTLDRAVYQAVAATSTPVLDGHFRQLSRAADHSVLWLGMAAVLAWLAARVGVERRWSRCWRSERLPRSSISE